MEFLGLQGASRHTGSFYVYRELIGIQGAYWYTVSMYTGSFYVSGSSK